ncbi:MAG TPA: hypothetical protein VG326_05540 [Tepidisphaeraceae bacterium]|jgi:hemolysin activation/secretion protein|nr:hypothetical protein [Tepidisphaeraceae bacterium]
MLLAAAAIWAGPILSNCIAAPNQAASAPGAPIAKPAPEQVYPVSGLQLGYYRDHPGLPNTIEMRLWKVKLEKKGGIYVPRGSGGDPATLTVGKIPPNSLFSRGAISSIDDQIRDYFHNLGIKAVFVSHEEIDSDGHDNRSPDNKELSLKIVVGVVSKVQTVTEGEDVPASKRINAPVYKSVRANSPVTTADGKNFVNSNSLDDYLALLNRRGTRHVDAALSSADAKTDDELTLDYIVREGKPWTFYVGGSNTGTRQTNEWRERAGFIRNNLFAGDDTLTLDYVTSTFDRSNTVTVDYTAPLAGSDRLRWNVHGDFSEFDASEIGITDLRLSGEDTGFQAELIYNLVHQSIASADNVFVDAFGGARGEYVQITNHGPAGGSVAKKIGAVTDVLPYGGIRYEHAVSAYATGAEVRATGTFAADGGDNNLGRTNLSSSAIWVNAQATQSIYIDPIIDARRYEQGNGLLAYELFGSLSGQYAFNYRLNPVHESIAGGLYTVRGYPESIAAGDSAIIATAEFRVHIPRLLGVRTSDAPLRLFGQRSYLAPPNRGVNPDWDLMIRPFIDAAYIHNNGSATTLDSNGELHDHTLVGAGVGAEFQFHQSLTIRVDYGIALKSVDNLTNLGQSEGHGNNFSEREASAGSSRVHFSLLYVF